MKKNDLQSEKHDRIIRKMGAEVCKGLVNDQLIFRTENRNEKNDLQSEKHDKIIRKIGAKGWKGLVNDQMILRAENRNEKK